MQKYIKQVSGSVALPILFTILSPLNAVQASDNINDIQATQTSFQALACDGCSAAQMRTKALQSTPPGNYVFVYNLSSSSIRKYRIYLDSTCKMDPVPDKEGNQTESNPVPLCGSYKDAIESSADQSVQQIFNSMLTVNSHQPLLLSAGKAGNWWVGGNGINRIPNDPSTGQPFNLPNVAWEYPQGAGYRFMEQVQSILQNQSQLRLVDPDLAALIYDVWIASANVSVTISVSPSITAQGNLQVESERPVQLKVCNTAGDCADLEIRRDRTQISVSLKQVVTRDGNMYPTPSRQTPTSPQWSFPNGGGDGFADNLRAHGVDLPGTSSGWGYISCSWQGNRLIGCIIYNN